MNELFYKETAQVGDIEISENDEIENAMKKFYGCRYFNEYSSDAVTGEEFNHMRKLIDKCISIHDKYRSTIN